MSYGQLLNYRKYVHTIHMVYDILFKRYLLWKEKLMGNA